MAEQRKDRLMCECAVSFHTEQRNGRMIAVWDEQVDLMTMCFGRCRRCGLPFHTEFSTTEVFDGPPTP